LQIAREAIEGITAEAEIGRIYKGKVVTIKEFGAFVEFLPGRDGLCHVSELADFRVKNVEDVVKMGDEIMVKCLGVDEKGRVRLSRKAAMEDRGEAIARPAGSGEAAPANDAPPAKPAKFDKPRGRQPREGQPPREVSTEEAEVGKNYRGRVVSTKDFGAFIEYLPGKEGLCHVSELANFRVKKTEDIVKVGDEITIKYLGLDEKGRVRLSRKAVIAEREEQEKTEPAAPEAGPSEEPKS
jgi:polyribonucleotide nucleotidyltransferase